MRPPPATWLGPAFALLLLLPVAAESQAVLGPQDDALVLPRGVLRARVLNQWVRFDERYGMNTPGRPDGALEPIGIDFNLDTVGTNVFRNLTPLESGLRQLTGIPDFTLSLGRTVLTADVNITVTPFVFELGVTNRLSMGLVIPYVRTRSTLAFNANPLGREGNAGFNPALTVQAARDANTAVVTSLHTAAGQLEAMLGGPAFCTANPGDPRCVLIANTRSFADGVAATYGTTSPLAPGSPFIPIAETDAQLAIEARIRAFESFYGAPSGSFGNPFASQAPLTVTDAQRILTDPAFGINAEPLETVERSGIGDIELGAKYLLFDTMLRQGVDRLTSPDGLHFRGAVGALFRFGTGEPDSPDHFADVGTGQGQNDLELRGFADIVYGRHLFTSLIGRYGWQFADRLTMRIPESPESALAAEWRRREVERDLGDFFELEANQRVVVNDYVSVTGHYMYRHKYGDRYTGTFEVPADVTGYAPVTLDASILNQQTEAIEHRLGGGLSFSTVAAFAQGRVRLPIEVTYFHFQTTRGWGGQVPKLRSDQIQVRVYFRLFGGP
ncbi:MAG TPA: hypothetical protein VMM18_15570 [Gemmatimonadaceae bacterium]|nr:hypothetical protein [Gemmatimonadaceae bacterium]